MDMRLSVVVVVVFTVTVEIASLAAAAHTTVAFTNWLRWVRRARAAYHGDALALREHLQLPIFQHMATDIRKPTCILPHSVRQSDEGRDKDD